MEKFEQFQSSSSAQESGLNESVGTKLLRESNMVMHGIAAAVNDTVKDPASKLPEFGLSVGVGIGLKTIQSAGAGGRLLASTIGGALAIKIGYDELTGNRWSGFNAAVSDNWNSPRNFQSNVNATKDSVGSLVVDTAVGAIGFKASGAVAKQRSDMEALKAYRSLYGSGGEPISPGLRDTITGLSAGLSESSLKNTRRVLDVANLVGAGATTSEYTQAYNALAIVEKISKPNV